MEVTMRFIATLLAVAGSLGLAACAVQPPEGPSFAAMPGNGKTYDQFQQDNARCQQNARYATGPVTPTQAANQSAVGSAVAGTALGAAAGALVGSTAGAVGTGAAVGAGVGLLAGSAIGASNAQASSASLQRTYDINYAQCMAAAGEKVPDLTAGPAAYPAPAGYAPAYGYAYPYPYYGPAYYYGPPVAVGVGFGWGYGGWHRHW
jgi:outer membrane lipoprotein SlyB